MDLQLQGRRALVTGASQGIGRAIALGLAREGVKVAAVARRMHLLFDASKAVWQEGMTLNFWRIHELTHAVVPSMKQNNFGRIVNLTGTSEPKILNAAFSAKAAVHVWAKGLSREVAPHGITINSLQPGRIRSEQIDKRYPTDEARREFSQAEIPAGRFGDANEIGNLAIFLASPLAAYITGTVIPVDGGMSRFAF